MRIDILTLFPNMFEGFKTESIIKRAINSNKVEINIINFRKYSKLNNSQVDDTPYGGGVGMILMPEPIFDCIDDIRTEDSKIIIMTPSGKTYKQSLAYDLAKEKHLIIICGHYEGFDERILSLADYEISVGDYIVTGGELPAMMVADSIIRLLPGVINERSHIEDSFNDNYLLDYPTYTKPREFRGMKVPDILLSGDHEKIAKWRSEQSLKRTQERRPDLLEKR